MNELEQTQNHVLYGRNAPCSLILNLRPNNSETMTIFDKIRQWGTDRNFYGEGGATVQSQFVKLAEEMGELAGNIARGKDCTDDIGDIVVVLTHIATLQGKDIEGCIEHSYNDIKDRKGEFRDGSFIKESDL